MTDLLYNGFYCFEAMTERDLDQTICGICGVVGEIYLGDGNEKNCCSRKEVKIIISHFRPGQGFWVYGIPGHFNSGIWYFLVKIRV